MTPATMLTIALKWAHIVAMVGIVGGILVFQLALSPAARREGAVRQRASRALNALLAVGMVAGAALYVVDKGWTYDRDYNAIMIAKACLLLGVGATMGIGFRRPAADALRWGAVILLAIAALLASAVR
jgi:hypothetical protein